MVACQQRHTSLSTILSGAQRAAGTVLGGFIGLGFMEAGHQSLVIIVSFFLTVAAIALGAHFRSEYGAMICIITYILVIGFQPGGAVSSLLVYCLGRICAILAGILASFLASVFIFPKSATEIVRCMTFFALRG